MNNRVGMIAVALLVSVDVNAATSCITTVNGNYCTSEIDMSQFFEEAVQSQYQTQWCWAASIAMVFAYHGHPVDQTRIVTEAYGAPANMPAPGYVMATQLNRDWIDNSGQTFAARVTGLYDSAAGIYLLDNNTLIQNLDSGKPVLIGARTHAVVLTSMSYYQTPLGPQVVEASVFDPWPGFGFRTLDPDELVAAPLGGSLIFAATVDVTDVATPVPSGSVDTNGSSGGGGGCTLRAPSNTDDGYIDVAWGLILLAIVVMRCARHWPAMRSSHGRDGRL